MLKSKCHPNPRLAKIHGDYRWRRLRAYLAFTAIPIRAWVKRGLPTTDDQRPMLILWGAILLCSCGRRRTKNKRTCKPGEIYCVRCRAPGLPAGDMADYQPVTENLGNLIAICSDCDAIMYRRINLARLQKQVRGQLDITLPASFTCDNVTRAHSRP